MVDLRTTNAKLLDRAIRILMQVCPALTRSQAAAALDAADGELKTAILMQRAFVDAIQARKLLEHHGGHLRLALLGHERM
jgi:N-acetylmuramic acid 6-phosphate etherase